jgi:hypothetical protein
LPDLSPEARKVFNKSVSGWYGELHPWSKPHAEYNSGVKELWDKNKYTPSKMTKEDAEDFYRQIMRSRDPRIADFREAIATKAKEYRQRQRAPGREGNGE